VLSCARATQSGVTMRPWQDALMAYLDEQQRSKTKT